MAKTKHDIPDVLVNGLEIYKESSAKEAIKAWSEGSSQHGTADLDDKVKSLRQIEAAHGKFMKYKVEDVQMITPTAHLIFLQLSYERSDIPARFLAYKQNNQWILANFLFDISLQATKAFLV